MEKEKKKAVLPLNFSADSGIEDNCHLLFFRRKNSNLLFRALYGR